MDSNCVLLSFDLIKAKECIGAGVRSGETLVGSDRERLATVVNVIRHEWCQIYVDLDVICSSSSQTMSLFCFAHRSIIYRCPCHVRALYSVQSNESIGLRDRGTFYGAAVFLDFQSNHEN